MSIWKFVLLTIVLVCSGCGKERIGESTSVFAVHKKKIILYSDGEILITKINMTDDSLKNALLKAACL